MSPRKSGSQQSQRATLQRKKWAKVMPAILVPWHQGPLNRQLQPLFQVCLGCNCNHKILKLNGKCDFTHVPFSFCMCQCPSQMHERSVPPKRHGSEQELRGITSPWKEIGRVPLARERERIWMIGSKIATTSPMTTSAVSSLHPDPNR